MFGLERIQSKHNGHISNAGNVSASSDPKQQPNDATELLLKGAAKAAAGRELGLSEEETLAATSRAYRRQEQRAAYQNRNQRLAEWEQKQKTLVDEGFVVDSPDTDLLGDDEVDAVFGRTDYEMGLRDLDADNGKDTSEPEYETRGTRTYKNGKQYPIGNPVRPEERSDFQPNIAPKSVLRNALGQLEGATASGSIDAVDRLTRQVEGGVDAERERFLVQEAIKADAARFSPEIRAENDEYARNLASYYGKKFTAGGPGSMADEAIGRIAEIRKLGGSGALAAGEQAQVVRFGNDVSSQRPIVRDGVYFDPMTNNPIAIQGPDTPPQFRGANTPNTAQVANAPQPQNARTWLSENLPSPREGGRVFNDYPQVDITLATTNFAQKLRELDGYGLGNVSRNIRSADELQRVTDYVIKRSAEMGKPLYLKNEDGKNVRSANPGVSEVMQLLDLSDIEKQQLANALYQIETSQPSAARTTYQSREGGPTVGVIFDSPEAIEGNMAQTTNIARIPEGSTITGPGGKRIGIRKSLQGLNSPGAQKPFIGQVQGEKPRVNRFKPGNMGSGAELEARIQQQAQERAKGKPVDQERVLINKVKARLAEEREARDNKQRADKMSEIIAALPPNARRTRID